MSKKNRYIDIVLNRPWNRWALTTGRYECADGEAKDNKTRVWPPALLLAVILWLYALHKSTIDTDINRYFCYKYKMVVMGTGDGRQK